MIKYEPTIANKDIIRNNALWDMLNWWNCYNGARYDHVYYFDIALFLVGEGHIW